MGVNNNWRPVETMGDWMRDIEKRLMHEERRRSVPHPIDVVGRGFRAYALAVTDWNAEGPTVGGHFYSIANQVVNSPDDTKNWMGIVQSNSFGQGLQRVWEYVDAAEAPSPDPTVYTRAFVTNEDGSRTYTAWVTGGGGGGVDVYHEGILALADAEALNFVGGVAVAGAGSAVEIDILGGGGAPSGPAGGDLSGTYPNPEIGTGKVGTAELADNAVTNLKMADDSVGSAEIIAGAVGIAELATGAVTNTKLGANSVTADKIVDGVITDVDVNAANKDGTAATPSMRTLGTGATQAAAGNDARFTDARTPTGPAGGDLTGTYPNPQIAADAVGSTEIATGAVGNTELADNAVTSAKVQDGSLTAADLAPGTIPANLPPSGPAGGDLTGTYPNPEIGAGKVGTPELADGAVNSAKIADGTITDTDVAAANKDGAAGTASMRTLGTGATQAAAGNHTHTGMVVSFNGPLPALTAGTWTTVTHNLNRWPVAAMFYESGTEVMLDFRIGAGASVNAIEVRSDLAVGAGVYTVLVTG